MTPLDEFAGLISSDLVFNLLPVGEQSVIRSLQTLDTAVASSLPEPKDAEQQLMLLAIREFLITGDVSTEILKSAAVRLGMDVDQFGLVSKVLNRYFFYPIERELTGHGIQRTFRFWSSEEKTRYVSFASNIVDVLGHEFADVCFAFGSILAYVRDGEMLPHDDDLDIVVVFDSRDAPRYPAALRQVSDALRRASYIVRGDHPAHRWVSRDNEFQIDVFVALREGDHVSSHPAPRRAIPASAMFPTRRVSLFGVDAAVPNNPEVYVESVYGLDWRIPQPIWAHRALPNEYDDLFAA